MAPLNSMQDTAWFCDLRKQGGKGIFPSHTPANEPAQNVTSVPPHEKETDAFFKKEKRKKENSNSLLHKP